MIKRWSFEWCWQTKIMSFAKAISAILLRPVFFMLENRSQVQVVDTFGSFEVDVSRVTILIRPSWSWKKRSVDTDNEHLLFFGTRFVCIFVRVMCEYQTFDENSLSEFVSWRVNMEIAMVCLKSAKVGLSVSFNSDTRLDTMSVMSQIFPRLLVFTYLVFKVRKGSRYCTSFRT